jgi:hypothetical protein
VTFRYQLPGTGRVVTWTVGVDEKGAGRKIGHVRVRDPGQDPAEGYARPSKADVAGGHNRWALFG